MEYRYLAQLHSPFICQGKRYAKIRVIDTSTSRPSQPRGERWRVTYDGLKRALNTILTAKLIGPPEEGHSATKVMGIPVRFTMPDGYLDVIYEIVDDEAWKNITAGKWRSVSPQVTAQAAERDGEIVTLNDFKFDHVAFVDEGAFPSLQIQDFWEDSAESVYKLSAELYRGYTKSVTDGASSLQPGTQDADQINTRRGDSSLPEELTFTGADAWDTADAPDKFFAYVPEGKPPSARKLPLASIQKRDYDPDIVRNALARFSQTDLPPEVRDEVLRKICRVAKQLGIQSELCEKLEGEVKMAEKEECAKRVEELEEKIKTLEAALAKEKQRNEILERRDPLKTFEAELKRLKEENQALREWQAKKIEEEHLDKVAEIVDLRIRAGLVDERDRQAEIEKFKVFSADALDALKPDLLSIIAQVEAGGPKAKFYASKKTPNDLTELVRQRLFGYMKEGEK
jgi:hypothetical protein